MSTEKTEKIEDVVARLSRGNVSLQESKQEIFPPPTEAEFRERPFAQKLGELENSGSGGMGGVIGKELTIAAYRQLEHELHEARERLDIRDNELRNLSASNASTKEQLALAQQSLSGSKRSGLVSSAIYLFATSLIGLGWSEFDNNLGKAVFAIGALLFIVGFVSLMTSKSGGRNE